MRGWFTRGFRVASGMWLCKCWARMGGLGQRPTTNPKPTQNLHIYSNPKATAKPAAHLAQISPNQAKTDPKSTQPLWREALCRAEASKKPNKKTPHPRNQAHVHSFLGPHYSAVENQSFGPQIQSQVQQRLWTEEAEEEAGLDWTASGVSPWVCLGDPQNTTLNKKLEY